MSNSRGSHNGLIALALLAFGFAVPCSIAEEAVWRFDCGPSDSPVMKEYQRLTAEDRYEPERGFGWESGSPQSVEFENPGPPERPSWVPTDKMFAENRNDLNCDAVVDEGDLTFRADVPDGLYRVSVVMGDLSQAIGSIEVTINDELAAEHFAAWAPGGYRFLIKEPIGWWGRVRHTVRAEDGFIRIQLRKNQDYYDRQMAEQMTWPDAAYRYGSQNPPYVERTFRLTDNEPPYFYIGFPFVRNSVMAIEIAPYAPPMSADKEDRLELAWPTNSSAVSEAVERFNARDFESALKALAMIENDAAKASVALWLAGRPEVEGREKDLVPTAAEMLRQYKQEHPEAYWTADLISDAEIFQKAQSIFLNRGLPKTAEERTDHFKELHKAVGWWWMINEDSPLYYKSQIYIARATHMLLPYVPSVGTEVEILRNLEEKFPDNRYVKYFL